MAILTNDNHLYITKRISIPLNEIDFSAMHSGGPGGQHVNKVASAVQLKFDIPASSLPDYLKERLLQQNDSRISKDGILTIKAQQHRSQKKNKDNALARLQGLVRRVLSVPKSRIPTKPTKSSQVKRIENKKKRGELKKLRRRIDFE
jgi:ribosome-associated protein